MTQNIDWAVKLLGAYRLMSDVKNEKDHINQKDKTIESLEAELRQLREDTEFLKKSFHDAIEVLDDGFVIFDSKDQLFTYNKAFKEQFGAGGKFLEIGKTYEYITTNFARSGIIPNIKGKEVEFVKSLIENRKSEEGVDKIFENHKGEWIRHRDKRDNSGNLVGLRTNVTEIKMRENELARASQMFTEATNSMVQGMAIFKAEKLQFFNPNLLKLLNIPDGKLKIGCSYEEFLNTLKSLGHYDNNDEIVQKNLELMSSRTKQQLERETEYGVHLRVDVIPSDEDSVLLTYTDITESRNREKEIEIAKTETELTLARQENIANVMAQGIIMFEHGKVVFYNKQALNILEITEEILFEEQSFEKFLTLQLKGGYFNAEDKGKSYVAQHMEAASSGVPFQLERTTKNRKTVRVDGVPNKKENSLTLTLTDISTLKEREIETNIARNEAERMSKIQAAWTNAMVPGLIIFDDNKLSYLNPRTLELLGANEDSFTIGMPISEVIKVQATLGDFSHGTTDSDYQTKLHAKIAEGNGYSFERQMLNGKVLKVDGVPTENNGLIVSYTDITDVKERAKELEEAMKLASSAERAKSEFLANMSHEIRTPMNGVMGMAELLASTELDPKQKMFTDVIVKSGASLLTIINDILDFSKIDAGQMELDSAPFALSEAIEDVATLVSSKVAEKDLELIVRVDPSLPEMLIGDVDRIRQIITNLLGNAVKFTEKGHIFVNIENANTNQENTDSARIKFSIEDTGIGIPEEKCEQVFNKFSQADTSATRKHEGTGLGLSISSSLVELMGGTIEVDSEVGKGSKFWFEATLPIHNDNIQKQAIPSDMTNARVLVIDDNDVNRSILQEQMNSWNFDSASTSTGSEGLEVMRAVSKNNIKLDLVILDYQMPEMSGTEVLEIMRNEEALKDIPVLMLTSVDSSQTHQRLIKLGAEANLTKPARSSMLLETILQVIANSRANIKTNIGNIRTSSAKKQSSDKNKNASFLQTQQLDILVAEDNEVNQIVFQQILKETNLNYKIVENGSLAFAAYKAQKPSLILMDVSMPEMNGKEATQAIRKFERQNQMKRTPIVGVTAHALKGDMESCIDAGMDDYLSKPVSPKKLKLKIEQWLKLKFSESKLG